MNKKILAGVTMFGLMLAYALPFSVEVGEVHNAQAAQSDYFLKIDTIDGESTKDGHKNEIEILSWSFGATNSGSMSAGGGMSAGKVQFQDFHFTKMIDKATPKLFLSCANGKHIPKVELAVARPNSDGSAETFMKYTFTDIMVTSCQNSADPLIEEVSFNYAKIEMSYTPTTRDGKLDKPVTAGWDLKMNKGI